ncbi:alpha/beta hydrolase [Vibrio sinaloensis]|uniref:COG3904 family protein n=1 Tax=Photobacterium sp. (strain ATCC 43367) TaxID=379097 RepID=UPI00057F7E05|nr:alpha/beta hydrolase [Vibrio sinaloensis]KHT47777.1 alpha/beta hydrolase [Vibrio sinaloensis]
MKKLALLATLVVVGCNANNYDNIYTSKCDMSLDGDKALTFYVKGNVATLSGVVCSGSPDTFEDMLEGSPQVNTLVFKNINGSADDEANTELGYMVRDAGMNSVIGKNGHIASGGTDLFLAGLKRTVEPGAKIGVHSWASTDGMDGSTLPRDHQEHQRYLKYYETLGIDTDFYWFTLDAAKPQDMHYMTRDELVKYGVEAK